METRDSPRVMCRGREREAPESVNRFGPSEGSAGFQAKRDRSTPRATRVITHEVMVEGARALHCSSPYPHLPWLVALAGEFGISAGGTPADLRAPAVH